MRCCATGKTENGMGSSWRWADRSWGCPVPVRWVKCDPRLVGTLRCQEGFHEAYHMNKEKWISIRLDGSVPESQIKTLLALSYDLTDVESKMS